MITFTTLIHRFEKMGEKTGWTYVDVLSDIAEQLKLGTKKSFRIKGLLDKVPIQGIALLPMGDGNFILPLKASLRKKLGKGAGAILQLSLEEDKDFKISVPEDLSSCLQDDTLAQQNFNDLPVSQQHYFINWINNAKTSTTRIKRIALSLDAMQKKIDYGQMIRNQKITNSKLNS